MLAAGMRWFPSTRISRIVGGVEAAKPRDPRISTARAALSVKRSMLPRSCTPGAALRFQIFVSETSVRSNDDEHHTPLAVGVKHRAEVGVGALDQLEYPPGG